MAIGIFFADGCEEIEGLTVVDMMRRGGVDIVSISITDSNEVTGSHKISFKTDAVAEEVNFDELEGIVLPGGLPGTTNLDESEIVKKTIKDFAAAGKLVAAICAAPSVLGHCGLLEGKNATCHPGWEEHLTGANCKEDKAVTDGNIITSRGMGTAVDFSLAILQYFNADVEKVKKGIVY